MAMTETAGAFKVKILRGDTASNDAYTGPDGEITIDSEAKKARIHDGVTQGGFPLASTAELDAQLGNIAAILDDINGV